LQAGHLHKIVITTIEAMTLRVKPDELAWNHDLISVRAR
jgi:hypothetical protein